MHEALHRRQDQISLDEVELAPFKPRRTAHIVLARSDSPRAEAMMAGPTLPTLLEDRFKLKIHHESKEVPA
jgi:uncharacterized protein (TIGR03435 family)